MSSFAYNPCINLKEVALVRAITVNDATTVREMLNHFGHGPNEINVFAVNSTFVREPHTYFTCRGDLLSMLDGGGGAAGAALHFCPCALHAAIICEAFECIDVMLDYSHIANSITDEFTCIAVMSSDDLRDWMRVLRRLAALEIKFSFLLVDPANSYLDEAITLVVDSGNSFFNWREKRGLLMGKNDAQEVEDRVATAALARHESICAVLDSVGVIRDLAGMVCDFVIAPVHE